MKNKVAIACSGLGYIKRGLETFSEALFYKLQEDQTFEVLLLKGAGKRAKNEFIIVHFKRHWQITKALGKFAKRHPFQIQNLTFAIGLIFFLFRHKIDVIYCGEPAVYNILNRWRNYSSQKFRIIFFTGGQTFPFHFNPQDILHHVTPILNEKAIAHGIATEKQFVIPHFIAQSPSSSVNDKARLRTELGLPLTHKIILAVGAIDRSVKRMDYIIDEVSRLPPNFFLLILGEREEETPAIENYATSKLKARNFSINTVLPSQLSKYYQAADMFVLASLKEGFGLVFLEALAAGLPVITHDHAVARFVLKEYGHYADLTQPGTLREVILKMPIDANNIQQQTFVAENYSWKTLSNSYKKMLAQAIQSR